MPPSKPFFLPRSQRLDKEQIIEEAIPLAKLIGAVGVVALLPLLLQFVFVDLTAVVPFFGIVFTLATQFVLAVGTGIILLYLIVRANQLLPE